MSSNILIVDDEPALLEQAKIFLERESEELKVETTQSGEEAFRMIKEQDFDAVIADYLLPDMDGVEILQKVREEGDDILFLILTGRDSGEAEETCLESGADGFFVKSGSPASLYRELAEAILKETG